MGSGSSSSFIKASISSASTSCSVWIRRLASASDRNESTIACCSAYRSVSPTSATSSVFLDRSVTGSPARAFKGFKASGHAFVNMVNPFVVGMVNPICECVASFRIHMHACMFRWSRILRTTTMEISRHAAAANHPPDASLMAVIRHWTRPWFETTGTNCM